MAAKILRRCRRIALVLLPLYVVFLAVAFAVHLPDACIITTNTGPVNAFGATRLLIPFQGGNLEIFTARSPAAQKESAQAYVLLFVGNDDRADKYPAPMAAQFGKLPIEVWGVNYPGFGESTGPARLSRLGPAALAAYDALAGRAKGRPIVVRGASLGTLGALCIAARRPVAALWLHNPVPLPQLICGEWGWWNLWLFAGPVSVAIPHDIDSVANARLAHAPCTFLLSDSDEVVPPRYHRQIVDAYAGRKNIVVLPHALHNSPIDPASAARLANLHAALWKKLLPR